MSSAVASHGLSGASPALAASASARTPAMPSWHRKVRSSATEASRVRSGAAVACPSSAAAAQRSAFDGLPSNASICAPSTATRG
jgi:hypothetical protein